MNDRAQEILENPLYSMSIEALRLHYYGQWRQSPPGSQERDYWGQMHDIVDDLDQHLRSQLQNQVLDDFQARRRAGGN